MNGWLYKKKAWAWLALALTVFQYSQTMSLEHEHSGHWSFDIMQRWKVDLSKT
jgi:hypothetical protein